MLKMGRVPRKVGRCGLGVVSSKRCREWRGVEHREKTKKLQSRLMKRVHCSAHLHKPLADFQVVEPGQLDPRWEQGKGVVTVEVEGEADRDVPK